MTKKFTPNQKKRFEKYYPLYRKRYPIGYGDKKWTYAEIANHYCIRIKKVGQVMNLMNRYAIKRFDCYMEELAEPIIWRFNDYMNKIREELTMTRQEIQKLLDELGFRLYYGNLPATDPIEFRLVISNEDFVGVLVDDATLAATLFWSTSGRKNNFSTEIKDRAEDVVNAKEFASALRLAITVCERINAGNN